MNDTISRQAAIDAIRNMCEECDSDYCGECRVGRNDCEKVLEGLPSVQPERCEDCKTFSKTRLLIPQPEPSQIARDIATIIENEQDMRVALQPEQRWIPCSETVDIPDHEIMACDKYGELMFGYLAYEDEQWLCESDGSMMVDPIAWREKPEPYQEEGED